MVDVKRQVESIRDKDPIIQLVDWKRHAEDFKRFYALFAECEIEHRENPSQKTYERFYKMVDLIRKGDIAILSWLFQQS